MTKNLLPLSIVVTTYNWPDALRLVLLSLNAQDADQFEVIIGDDGSRAETTELIQQLKAQVKYPLKHVWQPDDGFRAAAIRNKAVAAASGDYIVFLDGDCVVPRWFVRKHRALAEKNWYVVGRRILLWQQLTQQAIQQRLSIWNYSFWRWLWCRCRQQTNNIAPWLTLPLGWLRKLHPKKWRGARTCNLGVWKQDFIHINGFDESFIGWGYEDSDLSVRLMRSGIRRKSGRFAAPVLHLWHKENDRSNERANYQAFQDVLHSDAVKAKQGIDQYL